MEPEAEVAPSREPTCVLALGTSTQWCCAALQWRDATGRLRCDSLTERAGQEHSRLTLSMAGALLRGAGIETTEVQAIAFDAGPGSFTGLRIGCGIAQGLGFALGRPVVPVASLEALAIQASAATALVAVDARMDEVYCAAYRLEGVKAIALGPLRVLAPRAAAQALLAHADDRASTVAIGDGFARYESLAQAMRGHGIALRDDRFPRAHAIAAVAWHRVAKGEVLSASEAAPLYVRDKVALDVDEQRRLRAERAGSAAAPAEGAVAVPTAGRD